tara:strand:- start:5472 stop:5717 length:246 start_codon:yes stop_codon:yes gene_type:complete
MTFHFNGKLYNGEEEREIREIFESIKCGREGRSISKPQKSITHNRCRFKDGCVEILMTHEEIENAYNDIGKTWEDIQDECM